MQTVKRIVILACCVAVCLCIAGRIKSRADTLPNASEILATLPNIDLTSITQIYSELTAEQTMIANYLLGAFNNIYLCARGFQYNIPADESNLKAQFIALGNRAWNYATSLYAGRSRVNEVFRQYLSGILVYVQPYNDFDDWYNEIRYGGNTTLYIPYSEDAFDAWTTFYNDPSGDGIAVFGDIPGSWQLGEFVDFAFTGLPWYSDYYRNVYNNWILNNSPVFYAYATTTPDVNNALQQYIFAFSGCEPPDSIFLLRSSNNTTNLFKFGYSDISLMPSTGRGLRFDVEYRVGNNYLWTIGNTSYQVNFIQNNIGSVMSYQDAVQYIVTHYSPFVQKSMYSSLNSKWYYPLSHVFLVDSLDTLSNPEELYYTETLNIVPPGNSDFIITPNGKFLNPVWPIADGDPMNLLDNIIDNSVDVDFNPVSEDDYHTTIVNNNVINNYYVSDSDLINVPVEWFDNPYTQKLGEDAIPFIGFARDCIDTLGDFDIYMFGAIVIGLGGGIVKKLLL